MPIAVVFLGVRAGKLQRALPGLSSAIAEESAVEAGDFREPLRQLRLIFVIEQVRSVNQLPCLLFQDFLDSRMRVAQRIHPDAAEEIQITFPGRVPKIDSATAGEEYLVPVVSRQQQLLFRANNGSQAH